MTSAPQLQTRQGPAADFAARLCAELPVLRTERLVLRAPKLEDAALWIEILSEDEAGHLAGPYTEKQAFIEFQASVGGWLLRGHGPWSVCDHAGRLLGFVLIGNEVDDQEPELGFLFGREARGFGYAREAGAAARDHALQALRLPSLVSYIAPDNGASKNTVARLGARFDTEIEGCEIWRYAAATPEVLQ